MGYVAGNALLGLQQRGTLEVKLAEVGLHVTVEWRSFTDDAALFRAIEEGRIDIGPVGAATPALLHCEEAALVYLKQKIINPYYFYIVL